MKDKIFAFARDGKLEEMSDLLDRVNYLYLNSKEDLDYSPLAIAVTRGHFKIVELLINKGFDVNTRDYKGRTPLHYVGEYNYLEIAKLLLANNGDLTIKNDFGNQPLWVAVFNVRGEQERIPLVKLFLEKGADPLDENNNGMSPLKFAKEVEDQELIRLLENY